MGVISVRIPDDQEAWIREHGEKPGTFARLAILKEIRRIEVDESTAFLEANRYRSGTSIVEGLQEDRGSH